MADSVTNLTVVIFNEDDPGGLWRKGDKAIDLGPEVPGLPLRMLKLHGMKSDSEIISLADPYERGIIRAAEGES